MSWSEAKKINSDLNIPLNEGGVKIVKSIQRGVGTATSISISEVNPDKCMLLIDGIVTTTAGYGSWTSSGGGSGGGTIGYANGGATLSSLENDVIKISNVNYRPILGIRRIV